MSPTPAQGEEGRMLDGTLGPLTREVLRAGRPALFCQVCDEGPFTRVRDLTRHLYRLHPSRRPA